ncbi:hypothetical protein AB838_05400 [Rhodobacteraceae bacterium (ex Bugula neritina AB1)]|nr:hypothetical protein AB838_05400 [Rhodobacteraceae bacterium (ex Bugula neritina AB1)]
MSIAFRLSHTLPQAEIQCNIFLLFFKSLAVYKYVQWHALAHNVFFLRNNSHMRTLLDLPPL